MPNTSDVLVLPPQTTNKNKTQPNTNDVLVLPPQTTNKNKTQPNTNDVLVLPPRGTDDVLILPPQNTSNDKKPPNTNDVLVLHPCPDNKLSEPNTNDVLILPPRTTNNNAARPNTNDVLILPPRPGELRRTKEQTKESLLSTTERGIGYNNGFYITDDTGNNHLNLRSLLQSRYTFTSIDSDTEGRQQNAAFSVERARLVFSGHAHTKRMRYFLQLDAGEGVVSVKDIFFDVDISKNTLLRIGQMKRPFSRQQIGSAGNLTLVDRASTDKAFGSGRDIGFMIHNNIGFRSGIEYAVGLFNGTGDRPNFSGSGTADINTGDVSVDSGIFSNVPDVFEPTLVARIGYNTKDVNGYIEGDFVRSGFRYGVGATIFADFDADNNDASDWRAQIDWIIKSKGLSTSGGIYVASQQDGSSVVDRDVSALGAHLQASKFLSNTVAPSIRYSIIKPDGADNDEHSFTGGISVFWHQHLLKWQTDITAILAETSGNNTTDILARTQLQLFF